MKVTVITVARNAQATIADSVASVHAQQGPAVEHILIDGASTDQTVAVAQRAARGPLRVVSEPDSGIYDAMNKGLRLATGDLVGFLNADDFYCRTDALAILASAAARTGADAVVAGVAIVAPGNEHRVLRAYPGRGFHPWMFRFGHMPPHPGFYARRRVLDTVGYYEPSFRVSGDLDWLLRFYVSHRLKAHAVHETLVAMRSGGVSTPRLSSMRAVSGETRHALERNGVWSCDPLIWARYLGKLRQYVRRPPAYPPPSGVRWSPGTAQRENAG